MTNADWISTNGATVPTKIESNLTSYYMVLKDTQINKQFLYISAQIALNSSIYEAESDVMIYA